MTQREALKKALEHLGGRAQLQDLYPLVLKKITYKPDSDIGATLRTTLKRNPNDFRHSPGKPSGWWELTSFQEEMEALKQEIVDLKVQLATKDKEITELKEIPTEDTFVQKLIEATKTQFRFKRNDADSVRIVMDKVGRADAEAIIGAWIEGREQKPSISVAGNIVFNKETNIDKNYGPNIENNGTLSLPDQKMAQ